MFLTVYAVLMLLLWLGASSYLIINSRKIIHLHSLPPLTSKSLPAVCIVIAVRNEEAEVEEALRSVCLLDYPNLRVVVINDRSTDRTPEILQRLTEQDTRLTLLTIENLPPGWLGKNHALYQGYLHATEEWLLFTDADVKYAPQALRKAMRYATEKNLDHLAVLPDIRSRSWLLMSVMNTFAFMLTMKLRPWDVSKPSSTASVGVGAFNLIKRSAYEKCGTHKAISLRPDDDLKLGERVKQYGLRQGVAYGKEEIWLQWYASLNQFIHGLMKNTFSVASYNPYLAAAMAGATFTTLVLPVPLLLFAGYPFALAALFILASQVAAMTLAFGVNARWWQALLVPFAGMVMVYIIIRSTILTLRQGGIYWRDSFYPLSELKKQA